jgi:hypothetical protein
MPRYEEALRELLVKLPDPRLGEYGRAMFIDEKGREGIYAESLKKQLRLTMNGSGILMESGGDVQMGGRKCRIAGKEIVLTAAKGIRISCGGTVKILGGKSLILLPLG